MSILERAVDKMLDAEVANSQTPERDPEDQPLPNATDPTERKSSLERATAAQYNNSSPAAESPPASSAPHPESINRPVTAAKTVYQPIDQNAQEPTTTATKDGDITPDWRNLESLGFVTPLAGNSATISEYRRIKRPLLTNVKTHQATQGGGSRKNLIQITSAREGEGKTFSALNMAMSIAAEMDQTVLLVDSDVYRNDIAKLLGIDQAPGLADLLADPSMDIGDIIHRIQGVTVSVITAGNVQPNNDELFASDRMKMVVSEIAERYSDRIVIFDSPPLLATSEAPVLLQLMGQVALVVSADVTPQHVVKEALDIVPKHVDAGIILNKASRHMTNDYEAQYGYAYPKN